MSHHTMTELSSTAQCGEVVPKTKSVLATPPEHIDLLTNYYWVLNFGIDFHLHRSTDGGNRTLTLNAIPTQILSGPKIRLNHQPNLNPDPQI